MPQDQYIIVLDCPTALVVSSLLEWIDLCEDDSRDRVEFRVFSNESRTEITIHGNPGIFHFLYLVNYLTYLDEKTRTNTKGYIRKSEYKAFLGQNIMAYVPVEDREYDNVFVVNAENKTVKFDFGHRITPVSGTETFIMPSLELTNTEYISYVIDPDIINKSKPTKTAPDTNYFIVLLTVVVLVYLILTFLSIYRQPLGKTTLIAGLAILALLYIDTSHIRSTKRFRILTLASTLAGLYTIGMSEYFNYHTVGDTLWVKITSFTATIGILSMRAFYIIYKKLFYKSADDVEFSEKARSLLLYVVVVISGAIIAFASILKP